MRNERPLPESARDYTVGYARYHEWLRDNPRPYGTREDDDWSTKDREVYDNFITHGTWEGLQSALKNKENGPARSLTLCESCLGERCLVNREMVGGMFLEGRGRGGHKYLLTTWARERPWWVIDVDPLWHKEVLAFVHHLRGVHYRPPSWPEMMIEMDLARDGTVRRYRYVRYPLTAGVAPMPMPWNDVDQK